MLFQLVPSGCCCIIIMRSISTAFLFPCNATTRTQIVTQKVKLTSYKAAAASQCSVAECFSFDVKPFIIVVVYSTSGTLIVGTCVAEADTSLVLHQQGGACLALKTSIHMPRPQKDTNFKLKLSLFLCNAHSLAAVGLPVLSVAYASVPIE
jgi:hypothetical protein